MILMTGGAYQGKLEYAKEHFGIVETDIYRCSEDETVPNFSKGVFNGFHLLVLAQVKSGIDSLAFIREYIEQLKDKIILSDDISCGIVPIDPIQREWREATGRCLALLTRNADQVYRVFCGLGTRLK